METVKSTKLIELKDDLFVEVEVQTSQPEQVSSSLAKRVESTIGIIEPVLVKLCRPVSNALQQVKSELPIEESEAQVEVNLAFTTEGNIYITKLQNNSSLKITLKFKPKT